MQDRFEDCSRIYSKKDNSAKKKSSNGQFSNSKSKKRSTSMQSSRKKRISVNTDNTFDLVNFEEFHTDSESSPNDNENLASSSLLFDHYNEVYESGDGNWLFHALSRGITCTPNYHGSIRNTVVQQINDNIERYQDFFNHWSKYLYI